MLEQAHRGTGNYAYVNVIREVAAATSHFRVLALSATPGSDVKVRSSFFSLIDCPTLIADALSDSGVVARWYTMYCTQNQNHVGVKGGWGDEGAA